jgi:hypothetical protein
VPPTTLTTATITKFQSIKTASKINENAFMPITVTSTFTIRTTISNLNGLYRYADFSVFRYSPLFIVLLYRWQFTKPYFPLIGWADLRVCPKNKKLPTF